ncbi:hypothetical protein BU25DRAFT_449172 [Macroventuria anomochaeta]|uniref:Uncharacterized protein n=1 Tax=Macroventuria anomochaeta TaxID=301207 RepID=A0ACB6RXZ1_9PLEO|nr:uncharacterized protein BU25DRAFT_449172 [Macroventuria anomochaeta]KAF2626593.1 hypothetical protein BU25DRAFT_449172 [Macroventuria anomochaeta]
MKARHYVFSTLSESFLIHHTTHHSTTFDDSTAQLQRIEQSPSATRATMAPFTNPLRHLWGRAPTCSAPDSIARFDGMSDGRVGDQQMHEPTVQQQQSNDSPAVGNGFAPPMAGQFSAATDQSAHQADDLQQYGQPSQQLTVHQNAAGLNGMYGLEQVIQELENSGQGQCKDMERQQPSYTATAQPPETSSQHLQANDHLQASHCPNTATDASTEVQVRREPAAEGYDDRDIFAEFTNEDGQDATSLQQTVNDTASSIIQASCDAPSIKQEPGTESRMPIDAIEGAAGVNLAITATHSTTAAPNTMDGQARASSSVGTPEVTSETGTSSSGVNLDAARPQAQVPYGTVTQVSIPVSQLPTTAVTDVTQSQLSVEQYTQDPRQSDVGPQAVSSGGKSLRSPSADSVIGSQKHSSEETALSPCGMGLSANSRLLVQQWQRRHKLSGMGPMTADAVQANPILLHGPMPTQQQYHQNAPQVVAGTPSCQPATDHLFNSLIANQTKQVNGPPRNSNSPYGVNMQYPTYSTGAQHGQVNPPWMPSGYGPNPSMRHARFPDYPLPGSVSPQRITEVQEEERSEASDDDELLVTRAPRHRSTTASPGSRSAFDATTSPGILQHGTSIVGPKPTDAAPKLSVPGDKQDTVIELSDDDDDEETSRPISWALPKYEATYHPPAATTDLPMAKVSIPDLVREEVMLTEDHSEQEMQLFLNVFLPAQQALQKPDPEPAHAVINFHTIAVMVLEAYVQYEIGDEMGCGYGFHGGNQALRPSPSSFDGEPARTRSAKDADVDEIFFAIIDRWRAGLTSGKGTLKLIRGCQEFCDIALDIIHYVKEHGLLQPELKRGKERSDKGVVRGPRGGAKEVETKGKATGKRKADAVESKAPAKKRTKAGKVATLQPRKNAKVEDKKKLKAKAKTSTSALVVIPRKK